MVQTVANGIVSYAFTTGGVNGKDAAGSLVQFFPFVQLNAIGASYVGAVSGLTYAVGSTLIADIDVPGAYALGYTRAPTNSTLSGESLGAKLRRKMQEALTNNPNNFASNPPYRPELAWSAGLAVCTGYVVSQNGSLYRYSGTSTTAQSIYSSVTSTTAGGPGALGYPANISCTTSGTASIAATNAFYANQGVTFGGTIPSGLTANQRYYVIATGLSGSAFQVAATPGGSAIVPGSGTFTVQACADTMIADLQAVVSATITSGNASIAATNSFVAGQAVFFATTVGNITAGATYYVQATGLSGSAFQVSTGQISGSVTPSASGTSNVQGVCYWQYIGPVVTSAAQAGAPTLSLSTSAPAGLRQIGNSQSIPLWADTPVAGQQFSVHGGHATNLSGAYTGIIACAAGNGVSFGGFPALPDGSNAAYSSAQKFSTETDSQKFVLQLGCPSGFPAIRVTVSDDIGQERYVNCGITVTGSLPTTVNSNNTVYLTVDLSGMPAQGLRKVSVESTQLVLCGIYASPGETFLPLRRQDYLRVAHFYDSQGGSWDLAPDSQATTLGKLLGAHDVWSNQVTGTGFVSPNNTSYYNYLQRVKNITVTGGGDFDLVVAIGSTNDGGTGQTFLPLIQGNCLAFLQQMRAAMPSTPIVIVGVPSVGSNNTSTQYLAQMNASLSAAVAQFNDPTGLTFYVDTLYDPRGPWLFGADCQVSPANLTPGYSFISNLVNGTVGSLNGNFTGTSGVYLMQFSTPGGAATQGLVSMTNGSSTVTFLSPTTINSQGPITFASNSVKYCRPDDVHFSILGQLYFPARTADAVRLIVEKL